MQDISPERSRFPVARTAIHRGLVRIAVAGELPASDDVLILRGPNGERVAARYAGVVTATAGVMQEGWELTGRYRLSPGGVALSSLIDKPDEPTAGPGPQHDWGALGLPGGADTLVSPAGDRSAQPDDVSVAFQSRGYAEVRTSRQLSIAPGDEVHKDGQAGMIVAIDRRKRTAEIRFPGETDTHTIDFEAIDDLESSE